MKFIEREERNFLGQYKWRLTLDIDPEEDKDLYEHLEYWLANNTKGDWIKEDKRVFFNHLDDAMWCRIYFDEVLVAVEECKGAFLA